MCAATHSSAPASDLSHIEPAPERIGSVIPKGTWRMHMNEIRLLDEAELNMVSGADASASPSYSSQSLSSSIYKMLDDVGAALAQQAKQAAASASAQSQPAVDPASQFAGG
jgi:hypothetical protein